jgi:hypothetical protein
MQTAFPRSLWTNPLSLGYRLAVGYCSALQRNFNDEVGFLVMGQSGVCVSDNHFKRRASYVAGDLQSEGLNEGCRILGPL